MKIDPDEALRSGVATGTLHDGAHLLPLRIYYEDTDAGGVVYHAAYLRFFERGRTEMLAMLGIGDVAALASAGLSYVVAHAEIRYRRPARLGDIVTIESRVVEIRGARCAVKHRVIRDGDLLVEGHLLLALVGRGGRPTAQPAPWVETFRAVMGAKSPACTT